MSPPQGPPSHKQKPQSRRHKNQGLEITKATSKAAEGISLGVNGTTQNQVARTPPGTANSKKDEAADHERVSANEWVHATAVQPHHHSRHGLPHPPPFQSHTRSQPLRSSQPSLQSRVRSSQNQPQTFEVQRQAPESRLSYSQLQGQLLRSPPQLQPSQPRPQPSFIHTQSSHVQPRSSHPQLHPVHTQSQPPNSTTKSLGPRSEAQHNILAVLKTQSSGAVLKDVTNISPVKRDAPKNKILRPTKLTQNPPPYLVENNACVVIIKDSTEVSLTKKDAAPKTENTSSNKVASARLSLQQYRPSTLPQVDAETVPAEVGRSLLLKLPREVRDMVYDLVYEGAFVEVLPFSQRAIAYMRKGMIQASARTPLSPRFAITGDMPNQRLEVQSRDNLSLSLLSCSTMEMTCIPTSTKQRQTTSTKKKDAEKTSTMGSRSKAQMATYNQKIRGAALLFTCRQISEEFGELAYSRTVFAFSSQKGIKQLLGDSPLDVGDNSTKALEAFSASKNLPARLPMTKYNRSAISHLCLALRPYGEPHYNEDLIWRWRYYSTWSTTCEFVADRLQGLESLTLFVEVPYDRPYTLSLDALWVAPLLQFINKKLKNVSITLTSPWAREVSKETLAAFAEVLHRTIRGKDRDTALEAIKEHKSRHRNDSKGRSLDRKWRLLQEWNGLSTSGENEQ